MDKPRFSITMTPDLLDKVGHFASARNFTRSAAIGELVARGLAALDGEAARSALERRVDEIAAVAYSNHAMIEWYLPQAFQSAETRKRPRVTGDLDLASSSDYFLAIGAEMARNDGNLGFALAETAGSGNDFKLNVKANDFADRADFAAYYAKVGARVQSERAQRSRKTEK